MELEKKDIEAIKYRLKKQNIEASNAQIRVAALNFEMLDLDAIADRVAYDVTFKESQIALPIPSDSKSSIVKIEAAQMGIELSNAEVLQIIDSSDREITDTAQYIVDIRELLRDFLYQRNQQIAFQNQHLIGTVEQVINEANQDKARIIADTNSQLMEVVNQCRAQSENYKSPYASRIQSLREALQNKAKNFPF